MEKSSLFKRKKMFCTHLTLGRKCPCMATTELSSDELALPQQEKQDAFGSSTEKKRELTVPCAARKRARACINPEEEIKKRWGYTTTLMLHDDLWKIKKVLQESDLGNMSRLLLPKELAENLVVPVLGEDARVNVESEEGIEVRIWDLDTDSMHHLIFKKWGSSRSYVFIGTWVKDFVSRRGLKKGDEIGFHWDSYKNHFNFTVFH